MKRLVFDIEADNLLRGATQIWCIVTKDVDTGEVLKYYGSNIQKGIDSLGNSDLLIGHNISGYDIPLIKKLYNIDIKVELFDTLIVSQLLNPDRMGGHSLDRWGQFFKRYKPQHEDWSQFSPEMLHRCTEDAEINTLLYLHLLKEMKR